MKVILKDFGTHTVSIGIGGYTRIPKVRENYLNNSGLNILHPKLGNPGVEDLLDKVVLSRSIPLDDGIVTLGAIKEKCPFMREYLDVCIKELNKYKSMI